MKSLGYLNQFFSLNCARDLIPFFRSCSRTAAKEITESFGCYMQARERLVNFDDYRVVVVGDGCVPRTGAVFAFLSRAHVTSIDPGFNERKIEQIKMDLGFEIHRLQLIKDKVENTMIDCERRPTLLVLPHSHADLSDSFKALCCWDSLHIINLPCCKDNYSVMNRYCRKVEFINDPRILSPKNNIYFGKVDKI